MDDNNTFSAFREERKRLLANELSDDFFAEQPSTCDNPLEAINDDSYDWTKQPLWKRHLTISTSDLRRRRKLIERLSAEHLTDYDAASVALDILRCTKSKPCNSPMCDFCRKNLQDDRQSKALTLFSRTPKKDLAFLTLLIDVTYAPFTEAQQRIRYLRRSIQNSMNYYCSNQVRIFGGLEIDVKLAKFATGKHTKRALEALGFDYHPDPAYLVHLHALVDLNGIERLVFRRYLSGIFNKPYQIRLSGLRSDLTKDESIRRISRYMFKFRAQYADNLFEIGSDKKAQYRGLFDGEILRPYVRLLHQITDGQKMKGFYFGYNVR